MKILVVGAGVMGLATAEALCTAGHAVAVYEQGTSPHDLASSTDEHRLIRYPYGGHDGYAALVAPAYAAWDRLWARLGTCHYVPTGTLAVSRETASPDKEIWVDRSAEGLERLGVPYEWLDAQALAARFPLLVHRPDSRGLYLDSGGLLLARPILESLAARVAALGGALHPRCRVTAIDPAGAALTLADGSRVSADRLIVTAGPWLPDLLPGFADQVTPSRQTYAYLDPPAATRAAWARHPMLLDIGSASGGSGGSGSGFYLVPPAAGTGMKIGDHGFSLNGHPDRDRAGQTADVAEALAMAGEHLAGFEDYRVQRRGTCFYTVTGDERFIAAEQGAAWILTGFSGHGFKFAPLIGAHLAEVIGGRRPASDFQHWISGRPSAMEDAAPAG
ncbi:MAG: NAD(P)/FAD-dependent oxidoreductase [Kiloniellaceae bacterium]